MNLNIILPFLGFTLFVQPFFDFFQSLLFIPDFLSFFWSFFVFSPLGYFALAVVVSLELFD